MKPGEQPKILLASGVPINLPSLTILGETGPWIPRGCFQPGIAAASVRWFNGGCALQDRGERRRLGDTSCRARDPDGPRRRPPALAAAKVKWGWDAAAPPVPPLRARGAQCWPRPRGGGRAPPPAPPVRQVRAASGVPSVPPALRPLPEPRGAGNAGTRGPPSRSRAARSAQGRRGHGETPLERFSARFLEATPRPGPAARPGARSPGCRRRQRAGEAAAAPRASRGSQTSARMPSPPSATPWPRGTRLLSSTLRGCPE